MNNIHKQCVQYPDKVHGSWTGHLCTFLCWVLQDASSLVLMGGKKTMVQPKLSLRFFARCPNSCLLSQNSVTPSNILCQAREVLDTNLWLTYLSFSYCFQSKSLIIIHTVLNSSLFPQEQTFRSVLEKYFSAGFSLFIVSAVLLQENRMCCFFLNYFLYESNAMPFLLNKLNFECYLEKRVSEGGGSFLVQLLHKPTRGEALLDLSLTDAGGDH